MARTSRIGFCGVLTVFAACATNELGLLPPDAPFDAAIDVPVVVIPDAPLPPDAPILPDAPPSPDAPEIVLPDAPVFDAPFDAYMPDACVPNPLGELCNGIDDNCNGLKDEGFTGLGDACSVGVGACKRDGIKICSIDGLSVICSVEPGKPAAFDLCGNGIDDNCNGEVDEGYPDLGQLCDVGVGACKRTGLNVCNATRDGVTCNATPGAPGPELCGNGIDDNCNGFLDEGFVDLGQPCSVGQGACRANGIIVCDPADLTRTRCGAVQGTPTTEICNGVDDDCDGDVDEGDPGGGAACTTPDPGNCSDGHFHCVAGDVRCVSDTAPAPDVCDGQDNDCNGVIDDGFHIGEPCDGPDRDLCARGHWECDGMFSRKCVGDAPETLEVCNGLDDDCDGFVDEDWNFNEDINNCGGCNIVCSNPHGTRDCNSAHCDPLCDRGWQSCDGNLNNGCETLRWTGSSCPADRVGSLSGDTGGDVIVRSGFGEAQYKVQIAENNDGIVYLSAEFALVNPTGVDMDLCVTCYGCGNSPAQCSRLGKGKTDFVFYQRDDHWFPFGIDDTRDVIVEVRFADVDRTACANWTLYMFGNINTDGQQVLFCND